MKIAYLLYNKDHCNFDKQSRIGYHVGKSFIELGHEVEYIKCVEEPLNFIFKPKSFYYNKIRKINYFREREPKLWEAKSRIIEKKISNKSYDLIFSIGSLPMAYLKTDIPKAFWTDITFSGLVDYYENYSNLNSQNIINGNFLETQAINNTDFVFFTSKWAKDSCLKDYKFNNSDKFHEQPFGPLIDYPVEFESIKKNIESKGTEILKFLHIGSPWYRKGCDIALDIVKELNKRGMRSEITYVGLEKDIVDSDKKYVKFIKYIDKNTKVGFDEFIRQLQIANYLIVPSRAEAFGHVFCEANMFGVPAIGSNTGGITSVILEGKNGFIFDINNIDSIIAKIENNFRDQKQYYNLCLNSFNEFENRLNWKNSVENIIKIING